jgi:hypothetical protein
VREVVQDVAVQQRHEADHQGHGAVPALDVRVAPLLQSRIDESVSVVNYCAK